MSSRRPALFSAKSDWDFCRAVAASASAVTLLCASACAGIWGFDDLRQPGGGDGGAGGGGAAGGGTGGEGGAIAPASGGGAAGQQIASGGAPPSGADDTAGGGPGEGDNVSGQGGSEISDASVAVTDATTEHAFVDAGASGSGGSSVGSGGTAGSSGSAGTRGVADSGIADSRIADSRIADSRIADSGVADSAAPGCGPSNCANGCCAGNRCVTVRSVQQCGMGGGACTACGDCQLCSPSGACTIDPASNWIVRCGSAELTMAPPTGATWDPGNSGTDGPEPDPFCQFELPSGVIDSSTGAATRTVNDSFTATWNQTVTAANTTITAAELMSANASTWRVWVGDTEFNGRATLACEVHPPLPASALVDGQLTIMNVQSCVSFTMTLVCQP